MSLVKYAAQQLIVSKSKIVRHSQQMFRMSAVSSDIIMEAHTPLLHCVVDDTLVKVFPLLHNALQQPFHSLDLLPVDSLLELVSLQTADILNISCECRTTFTVNDEFYCHINGCSALNKSCFVLVHAIIFSRFVKMISAKKS